MAGSVSAVTATLIAAGVAAAGVGVSAYDGAKEQANQKKSLAEETQATQSSEANSLSTERKNATAENQANQQSPDTSAVMKAAANAAKTGIGSTMLTGSSGAGTGTLGGSTLLGK
jgi:anionic cell wall polymer biosynthesis LytR-Cps2A-Psr (LCP) family protein